jgi:hypothetical protein
LFGSLNIGVCLLGSDRLRGVLGFFCVYYFVVGHIVTS